MYAKHGNLLILDGYYLINPKIANVHQDADDYMRWVNPDWAAMGTDNPTYQGIVFPAIYQYPDTPGVIGRRKARVFIEARFRIELP